MREMMTRWPVLAVLTLIATASSATEPLRVAQNAPAQHHTQRAAPAPPTQAKPAESKPQGQPNLPVNLDQALYLIRATLLTLNDANRSGNYTVLRDLAAPGFQTKNSAADLSLIFADLRRRHIDLYAAALMAPQLSSPPSLDNNRMLRLTGFFPTQPLRINFDLLFQNIDQSWRLFGISVQTLEVAPQAGIPPTTPR